MSAQELQVQEKQIAPQEGESTKPEKFFVPAVDIFETEEAVTVIAEMPGVGNSGVDVSLEDNILTIRGSKTPEKPADARTLIQEYESGSYLRRFTLAEIIDQEKIKATMANGMLTLVLPKAAPARPRKIEIQAG